MPQLFVRVKGPVVPFRTYYKNSPNAIVEAVSDLALEWSDSTSETIPQGTRVANNDDLSTNTFDSTTDTWMVVAIKGSPTQPQMVREKDYANLDTKTSGATWGVIYRITFTQEIWQQV